MPSGEAYVFGPFRLDLRSRHLLKDGEPLVLGTRQFDLLHAFASRPGQILSKDFLIELAWRDVAVTDNSLEQAISGLRRLLTSPDGRPYIETHARRGYRFSADVTRVESRETDDALDALLAPHRMWIEGRAALETLARDQINHARRVFEDVLKRVPGQAPAHVGLANACAMQFEMTRTDAAPDTDALALALHHAQEACRLDAEYGEAWATLGFVLDRTGKHADALAAARRAVALEPDNWRHRVRLSYTSWGEERLREARRALALLPGFPLAHWLAASVYVARQALSEAEKELLAGITAQSGEAHGHAKFSGVALHWLLGLIHLDRGDHDRALEAFQRELANEASGHLYARECCANTWYAIGALKLREEKPDEATGAFREAVGRLPVHPMAQVALAAAAGQTSDWRTGSITAGTAVRIGSNVDVAFARAASTLLAGGPSSRQVAGQLVDEALVAAPEGSAGWLLPLEPLLNVRTHPEDWASALARVRNRAA